jgi:hypothetical protein
MTPAKFKAFYDLAYWDQDNDPAGVAADIYAAAQDPNGRSQYKKLLTIPTFELVQQVFALDLIGKGSKQLVVVSLEGQLDVARIVQFDGDRARLVFDYAGTTIQFTDKAPYGILVYARSANQTELFRWSEPRQRFHRGGDQIGLRSGRGRRQSLIFFL